MGMRDNSAPEAMEEISHILWPGGDPDAEWDSETIEHVARVLTKYGWGPHAPVPSTRRTSDHEHIYGTKKRSTKRNSKRRHSRRGR